jgi:hypothetical protein
MYVATPLHLSSCAWSWLKASDQAREGIIVVYNQMWHWLVSLHMLAVTEEKIRNSGYHGRPARAVELG